MKETLESYCGIGGTVVLPGIETEIRLPRTVGLRYHGAVPDLAKDIADMRELIKQHLDNVAQKGQVNMQKPSWLDRAMDSFFGREDAAVLRTRERHLDDLAAYCYGHKISGRTTAYVIAIKEGLPEPKRIFADGHESGEFLDEIGEQQFLQDALEEAGIHIDVRRFAGEDFADIGGLLALRKAAEKGENDIALPSFRTREGVLKVLAQPFGF